MDNPPMMYDIWIYLSEHYLDKGDISSLSRTCRSIREAVFNLMFRRLVFYGTTAEATRSVRAFFYHFLHTLNRVQFLAASPHLTRFIREIEFRDWTLLSRKLGYIKSAALRQHGGGRKTITFHDLDWLVLRDAKKTFKQIMSMTDVLPGLKFLTFSEEDMVDEDDIRMGALNATFTQPLIKDGSGFLSFMIELRINRELNEYPSRIGKSYVRMDTSSSSSILNLIRGNMFPIVAAVIPLSIMHMLCPWDYSRFTSLQRLGICLTSTPDQAIRAQDLVRKILKISPHLQVIEILHSRLYSQPTLKMPSKNLALLRSFSGSFPLFKQLRHPLHTLRLWTGFESLGILLPDVPNISRERLQTLDLRDVVPVLTMEDLNSVAKTWPNLLHLIITDKGIRMKETNQARIIECIDLVVPFSRLEVLSIYAPGAARPLPNTAEAIFDDRRHKSLQEIKFPGHTSVVWNAMKGWMFQESSQLQEIVQFYDRKLEHFICNWEFYSVLN